VSGENTYPNDEMDMQAEEATEAPDSIPGEVVAEAAGEGTELSLEARLQQAETLAEEYLDCLQRERASFQNYRKRIEREREEQGRMIAGILLYKLLPILDDFYRAVDAVPEGEHEQWVEGIVLILRKFERFLQDEGVTEIAALGQPFDPAWHEAVGIDETAGAESGTVTQIVQRGYQHGNQVLRPALVRVAG
jgi:molecular chaperone GrpE